MKSWKRIQTTIAFIACCGMVVPTVALADQTVTTNDLVPRRIVETIDIQLEATGELQGKLVLPSGQVVPNAQVVVAQSQQVVAKTTTNADGTFRVANLRGGLYHLVAGGQSMNVRAWAARTAPPLAHDSLLVVKGNVVRGQSCTADSCTGTCGGACDACGVAGGPLAFLMNPFVIGAAVAAAIAIPLALDDDDAS